MIIRPSSAHRLMQCPGSLAAEAKFPNTTSVHAARGTAAHSLIEECWEEHLIPSDFIGSTYEVDGYKITVDEAMAAKVQVALDVYADYSGRYTGKPGRVYIEMQLEFGDLVGLPNYLAKGTADFVCVLDDEIVIVDYKNGEGVFVDVDTCDQVSTYGIAAAHKFSPSMNVKRVRVVVCQPGLNNIKERVMYPDDLKAFTETLRSRVDSAYNKPYFKTGPACQFCRAAATCPTLNQALVDEFESIPEPTKDEDADKLGQAMQMVPIFQSWCKSVSEACNARLNDGLPVSGYKLVQGRQGNRKWDNEVAVADELENLHLEPEHIYNMSVLSPTRIERLVKEGILPEDEWRSIQTHITRSEAKPTMVPESDARPAIRPGADVSDFEELSQ